MNFICFRGDQKECKFRVVLEGFVYNSALFGLMSYNDPCLVWLYMKRRFFSAARDPGDDPKYNVLGTFYA